MEGNEMIMRERRNACVMLAGKSAMWLPLGRAMLIRKDDIEMVLEQGDRIWRGFFWLRLGTRRSCGRTQLQTAVKKLFDDLVPLLAGARTFCSMLETSRPSYQRLFSLE